MNVLEKGTTNGTITDFDGKFTLNLSSPNAVLVFSYIGYVTQEISAKNQNELKVVLKEDAEKLDEVVVIGYGAVRKADVAGAVAVLDNKSFKDQPITQVSDALQGRVSGVQVENSGVPGGSVKFVCVVLVLSTRVMIRCTLSTELCVKAVWTASTRKIFSLCRC